MSNKMKKIDTKNWTHYFFADNINIKNFDPNNIKIDKSSHKNILKLIMYKFFIPYFQQSEWINKGKLIKVII